MEFRRLFSTQDTLFARAFALCKASTTACEQRSPDKQAALMTNRNYHFDVIMEDDELVGILLYWELIGYAYIEHFALDPSMRSRGLGRTALTMFCGARPFVILEIDPPVDEVTTAREFFYRLNFFVPNDFTNLHPGSRTRFFPRRPIVMSYPSNMTEQQYLRFQKDMKEIAAKDGSFLYLNQRKEWQ